MEFLWNYFGIVMKLFWKLFWKLLWYYYFVFETALNYRGLSGYKPKTNKDINSKKIISTSPKKNHPKKNHPKKKDPKKKDPKDPKDPKSSHSSHLDPNVELKEKIDSSSNELMKGVGKTKMERMSVVELRSMCLRMKLNVKGKCRIILNK